EIRRRFGWLVEYPNGMQHRIRVATLICVLATLSLHADQKRWWSHVEALANDGMAGRNTGSPEHQRAAAYVAAAFQRAGLEPAGGCGHNQPGKIKKRTNLAAPAGPSLQRNGQNKPPTPH